MSPNTSDAGGMSQAGFLAMITNAEARAWVKGNLDALDVKLHQNIKLCDEVERLTVALRTALEESPEPLQIIENSHYCPYRDLYIAAMEQIRRMLEKR